jgi:transcriptional regulator with XRE-family HTH domain
MLGLFLRQARGEQTYRAFARKLGIHYSTLHKLENGAESITLRKLELVMAKLQCTFDQIVPREFQPPRKNRRTIS